jgi:diadenosine tetraphosphate (Ap4A) HIT family hydrolase
MTTLPNVFTLHERLSADTFFVWDGVLSSVLLMNNTFFPWLILVPRVEEAHELIDLNDHDRHILMDEIAFASRAMQHIFTPDKLNVAALGNQVPMLHVHIIARYKTDAAWPNPVWGAGGTDGVAYDDPSHIIQSVADFYRNPV